MASPNRRPQRSRHSHRAAVAATAAVASGAALQTAVGFLAPSVAAPAHGHRVPGVTPAAPRGIRTAANVREPSAHAPAAALALGVLSALRRRRQGVTGCKDAFTTEDGGGNPEDVLPFEIRGFSLAQIFFAVGVGLLGFAGISYSITSGNDPNSTLAFIYGVPVLVLGTALAYAELPPVEVETAADAEGLFEKKATETLIKIKKDVTRHRYGDDAHLDSSLKTLGLTVSQGRYPQLKRIKESKTPDGELEFTMFFQSKDVPYTIWSDKQKLIAMDRFFGPGVWSKVFKESKKDRIAGLRLTTGPRPASEPLPKLYDPDSEAAASAAAADAGTETKEAEELATA